MIDTLKLILEDYSINKDCELTVQPSPIQMSTGKTFADFPLWKVDNEIIKGAKAYFNSEYFNFSISRTGHQKPGTPNAIVQFSIPKVVNGNNYAPVDKQESIFAIKEIERELSNIGVRTNLSKALVSRVDTFRNVATEESFASYIPVFKELQGTRMQKRDYGTTFIWENTQHQICVYDKIVEMNKRKASTQNLPSNIIRFEHRLLTAKKVKTALSGIRNVSDLFNGYDVLHDSFKGAMRTHLFRHEMSNDIETITAGSLEEDMRRFLKENERNWLSNCSRFYGLYYLSQRMSPETVGEVVFGITGDRKKAWRIVSEMQEMKMEAMKMKTVAPSIQPLSALYNELRLKVLD